jgi:methylmalonyl-CoA/ethylmalonyl-CoA epimerase
MLDKINHIAIAVPDMEQAKQEWGQKLGVNMSDPLPHPEHGVTVIFIELGGTKIELLEPLGEASPISRFLEQNPDGGMHHICFEVVDILKARDHLLANGARVLGDGTPKIGAHGKPVLFIHPKDVTGTLIELEQV